MVENYIRIHVSEIPDEGIFIVKEMKSDENDLNTHRRMKLTNLQLQNFVIMNLSTRVTDGVHVFIGEMHKENQPDGVDLCLSDDGSPPR